MQHESTHLDIAEFLVQVRVLREQSRQLRAETAALYAEYRRQLERSSWPHPVVGAEPVDRATLPPDLPVPQPTDEPLPPPQHQPIVSSAHGGAAGPQDDKPVPTSQQILDLMAEVLDCLPVEQQVPIVKALCGRTIAAARAGLAVKSVHSA